MFAFAHSFLLILAETAHAAESGGFAEFYNKYLNYPGFELWKFINLGIFVAVLVWLLRKPLSEQFKAKREAIRADLIRAEEEKQAALAQLTATESKLAALESEKRAVLDRARADAAAEKRRIIEAAEAEAARIREQADQEVARIAAQVKSELRRFSAEESIRRAEAKLRGAMDAEKDSRLVKAGIDAIGGLN
jgi:F-type H+-transporting ATPase subunit b